MLVIADSPCCILYHSNCQTKHSYITLSLILATTRTAFFLLLLDVLVTALLAGVHILLLEVVKHLVVVILRALIDLAWEHL